MTYYLMFVHGFRCCPCVRIHSHDSIMPNIGRVTYGQRQASSLVAMIWVKVANALTYLNR